MALLDTFVPENLLGGSFPIVTKQVTINAGQNLAAGAGLGLITGGNHTLVDIAALDGSEVPDAVLLEAVDATAADAVGIAGLTGEYLSSSMTFGGATTAADVIVAFRAKSIYLK